jgi:two-component system sensor kinase FixL
MTQNNPVESKPSKVSQKLTQLRKTRVDLESIVTQQSAELEELERTLLEAAERESRRLGRQLHDTLCQQILGAAFCAKALANKFSPGSPTGDDLQELADLLKSAVEQARNITHSMDPDLGEERLVNALRSLIERPRRGVKAALDCPESIALGNEETSMHLYRIAQEAVTNAMEHSGGTRVIVRLRETDGKIYLEVEDDGHGCPSELEGAARIGLKLMRIRARAISATLTFETTEGRGIRVKCVVQK